MFNRTSFDHGLYNRSFELNNVESSLRGTSNLKTNVVVQLYLDSFSLTGSGSVQSSPTILRSMAIGLYGENKTIIEQVLLQLKMPTSFSGSGKMDGGVGIRVPFEVHMSGAGSMKNMNAQYYQNIDIRLSGEGTISAYPSFSTYLGSMLYGQSDLVVDTSFKLQIPINISMDGFGDLHLRRIGALNVDTLDFSKLNLQPGQTLIIDSDELNVFIDNVMDVSSVTSDSVFFQLQPGENEITFIAEQNPNLEVTIIWQNRWL